VTTRCCCTVRGLSRIYYKRHFFPYPIGITLTVARRLGLLNTALIGVSYLKAQMFPKKDETFLDAFFVNRFGQRLYETFFRDYTEKVWGVRCDEIRADWGAQRVKGLSLKKAVVHAVKDLLSSDFQKAQQERETSLITRFFYPKFGPGQMWEIVASEITKAGGEIRHGYSVVGVTPRRPRDRGGGRGGGDGAALARGLRLLLLDDAREGAREADHAGAAGGGARGRERARLP
jgi:protoporphyrinogen oxidase